jgi:hypothetical protein
MKSQVMNELEKHQIQEAIQEMFIKNQYDPALLDQKVRKIENHQSFISNRAS